MMKHICHELQYNFKTCFISHRNSLKLMVEVTKRYNEHHREIVVIQISKENDLFFNFTYQVDSREFDKYVKFE